MGKIPEQSEERTPPMLGQGAGAKRGSGVGLCPAERRGYGGRAPIQMKGVCRCLELILALT